MTVRDASFFANEEERAIPSDGEEPGGAAEL